MFDFRNSILTQIKRHLFKMLWRFMMEHIFCSRFITLGVPDTLITSFCMQQKVRKFVQLIKCC